MTKRIIAIFITLLLFAGNAALVWYFPAQSEFFWLKFAVPIICTILAILLLVFSFSKDKEKQVDIEKQNEEKMRKNDLKLIEKIFVASTHRIKGKGTDKLKSFYDMPWYLVLGAKQDAKSSVLEKNGFEAVLQHNIDESDTDALIKFWSNEKAVVIEVGARIFDSDEANSFLLKALAQQLLKYRPRQAINGVISVIACERLLTQDQNHRQKQSSVIQEALLFLGGSLKLNIPVYALFSKADMLADFAYFFEHFSRSDIDNPFGITLPFDKSKQFDKELFDTQVDALLSGVMDQQFERLRSINVENASSVIALPYQLRMMFSRIAELFGEMGKENRMGERVWLRGAYLLSCTQKGLEFDLLSQSVAERANFNTQSSKEGLPGRHSFFASSIFSSVLLPEKGIVGVNEIRHHFYILSRSITLAVLVIGVIVASFVMKNSWDQEDKWRVDALSKMRVYEVEVERLQEQRIRVSKLIEVLNELRNVTYEGISPKSWYQRISYKQGEIANQMYRTYEDQLQAILLPLLEELIRNELNVYVNLGDQNKIFDVLRQYQMLFNKQYLDSEDIQNYLLDIMRDQENITSEELYTFSLLMTDLFNSEYGGAIEPNRELISRASNNLDGLSPERLLYARILNLPEYLNRVDIRNQLGDEFATIFSFTPDFRGYLIPEIFTKQGFDELDLSSESPLLHEKLTEFKVINGDSSPITDVEMAQLSRSLQRLYYADYINYWKTLVNNIQVRSFSSTNNLVNALRSAREPSISPLLDVLEAIVVNTTLAEVIEEDESMLNPNAVKAATKAATRVVPGGKQAAKLAKLRGNGNGQEIDPLRSQPAYVVNEAFLPFANFVVGTGEEGEVIPLKGLVSKFDSLYAYFEAALSNPDPTKVMYKYAVTYANGLENPISTLALQSTSAPQQISGWAKSISEQAWKEVITNSMGYINREWTDQVYRFYIQSIGGRFPFDPAATTEVMLDNFSEFFKPKGKMDQFIEQILTPFVSWDNSNELILKVIDGVSLPIQEQALNKVAQTRRLQQLFFGVNGQELALKVKIRPQELSAHVTSFQFLEAQSVFSYSHGPRIWSTIEWPSTSIDNNLSANFYRGENRLITKSYTGQWALFRALFDGPSATTSNRLVRRLNYRLNFYQLSYDYTIDGANQSLDERLFTRYSLPNSLH